MDHRHTILFVFGTRYPNSMWFHCSMRTSVSDTLTKQGRTTNYIIVQTWTDIKWPNGKFQKLSHHYTIPVTVLSAYSEAVNYIYCSTIHTAWLSPLIFKCSGTDICRAHSFTKKKVEFMFYDSFHLSLWQARQWRLCNGLSCPRGHIELQSNQFMRIKYRICGVAIATWLHWTVCLHSSLLSTVCFQKNVSFNYSSWLHKHQQVTILLI